MEHSIKMFASLKHPDLSFKKETIEQLDVMLKHLVNMLGQYASGELAGGNTLSHRVIDRAIKKHLPVQMRGPAMRRARAAIEEFEKSQGNNI